MPRTGFPALRRTVTATVGVATLLHVVPCLAQRPDSHGFVRRASARVADFPASTGQFSEASRLPNGPVDLAAAALPDRASTWRMCRDCGYHGVAPKPFKAVALYANFQPLGGTLRYRF